MVRRTDGSRLVAEQEWSRNLDYVLGLLRADRNRASGNAKIFGSLLAIPLAAIIGDFITAGGPFRLVTYPSISSLVLLMLAVCILPAIAALYQSYEADWLYRQFVGQRLYPIDRRPALGLLLFLRDCLLKSPLAFVTTKLSEFQRIYSGQLDTASRQFKAFHRICLSHPRMVGVVYATIIVLSVLVLLTSSLLTVASYGGLQPASFITPSLLGYTMIYTGFGLLLMTRISKRKRKLARSYLLPSTN